MSRNFVLSLSISIIVLVDNAVCRCAEKGFRQD